MGLALPLILSLSLPLSLSPGSGRRAAGREGRDRAEARLARACR